MSDNPKANSQVTIFQVWRNLMTHRDVPIRSQVHRDTLGSVVLLALVVSLISAFVGTGKEPWRMSFGPAVWMGNTGWSVLATLTVLGLAAVYAAERWVGAYTLTHYLRGSAFIRQRPGSKYWIRKQLSIVFQIIVMVQGGRVLRLALGDASIWILFIGLLFGGAVALMCFPVTARIHPPLKPDTKISVKDSPGTFEVKRSEPRNKASGSKFADRGTTKMAELIVSVIDPPGGGSPFARAIVPLIPKLKKTLTKPPRIALVGSPGVGKTTTFNALFNQGNPNLEKISSRGSLPGNESYTSLSPQHNNLGRLETFVSEITPGPDFCGVTGDFDVIIWILDANVGVTPELGAYLSTATESDLKRLVIGINKIDELPGGWLEDDNYPSPDQVHEINRMCTSIAADVKHALPDSLRPMFPIFGDSDLEDEDGPTKVVAYTATRWLRVLDLWRSIHGAVNDGSEDSVDVNVALTARDWMVDWHSTGKNPKNDSSDSETPTDEKGKH